MLNLKLLLLVFEHTSLLFSNLNYGSVEITVFEVPVFKINSSYLYTMFNNTLNKSAKYPDPLTMSSKKISIVTQNYKRWLTVTPLIYDNVAPE